MIGMLVMNALSENYVITLSATSPAPHIVTYCDEDVIIMKEGIIMRL